MLARLAHAGVRRQSSLSNNLLITGRAFSSASPDDGGSSGATPVSFSHEKMEKDRRYQPTMDVPETLLKASERNEGHSIRGEVGAYKLIQTEFYFGSFNVLLKFSFASLHQRPQ